MAGKRRNRRRRQPACDDKPHKCEVCGQTLGIPGGYAGSGMCGPCCTGEASTSSEIGYSW